MLLLLQSEKREGVERMINKGIIYKPQINNHYNFNFVATEGGASVCVCVWQWSIGCERGGRAEDILPSIPF